MPPPSKTQSSTEDGGRRRKYQYLPTFIPSSAAGHLCGRRSLPPHIIITASIERSSIAAIFKRHLPSPPLNVATRRRIASFDCCVSLCPAASPSFIDPVFERRHRHQMPPSTASIEIHLRLPPPPSNAVARRQPLVTKVAAAWWESPVFMENEFWCCYALISWQGWGRQGRKPFYPSDKVHLPRNKCKYFEQRKLPKPRLSCCTKNHITARPSIIYL